MKALFLSVLAVTFLSANTHAADEPAAATLTSLTCVANNGAVIKTTSLTERGVVVSTTWGVAKRDFEAYVSSETKKNSLYINLDNGKTTHYVIALDADSTLAGANQKVSGIILQHKRAFGPLPRLVTMVRCELTLR